jgi:hypothetical protein
LPLTINEVLVTHVMTAIATASLFLFQMAILNAPMSTWFGKDGPGSEDWEETYVRTIIKREAPTRPT